MEIITLTEQNVNEVVQFLLERFKNSVRIKHEWDLEDLNEKTLKKVEASKYQYFYYANPTVYAGKHEKQVIVVIDYQDRFEASTILSEGDKIMIIDNETLIVQQTSIDILEMLEKKSLTTAFYSE